MGGEAAELVEVHGGMAMVRAPAAVLAEAHKAAIALKEVIKGKENPVKFNGEQYIESDDWQLLGKFYGLTAKVVSTSPVEFGGARGFEARAVVVDMRNGIEVSAAEAMCLNDEEKWSARTKYKWVDELDKDGKKIWVAPDGPGKKGHYKANRVADGTVAVPMFQLRSMAQTRACAKALRNVLAWVVVLAGYKPTVVEELTGDEEGSEPKKEPVAPTRASASAEAPAAAASTEGGVKKITEKQAHRFYAIWKASGKTKEIVDGYLADVLGIEKDADMTVDVYEKACAWAQSK